MLKVIEETGIKINKDMCKFKQSQLCFLGHIINENSVRPDHEKLTGISNLP
jgi:hypothetical protein